MADTKISQMPFAGGIATTDAIPVYRAGGANSGNVTVTVGPMAGLGIGSSQIELSKFDDGNAYDIWIDDVHYDNFSPAYQTGTAQGGATGSITLSSSASTTTNIYVGYYVTTTGGTGPGQTAQITAYNGSTKVATVSPAFTTAPDATTTYAVQDSPAGHYVNASDGSFTSINFNWGVCWTKKR